MTLSLETLSDNYFVQHRTANVNVVARSNACDELRRLERLRSELLSDAPMSARRLQKASEISEAFIDTPSPILIGLISMLIGSDDPQEIYNTLQRLYQKGLEILNPRHRSAALKKLGHKDLHKLTVKRGSNEGF